MHRILSAFTHSKDTDDYQNYPGFINFAQHDDHVTVTIRNKEVQDIAGLTQVGSFGNIDIPTDIFKALIKEVAKNVA